MNKLVSFGLGVAVLSLLLSVNASAATLARQCGAFGIVTYDLPPVAETQTTTVPVPYAWLDAHVTGVAYESEAYEAAAQTTAANGRKVWECYALGLDPADTTNDLRIVSIKLVDGKPKVEWEPKTNRWTGVEIQAVLKGAEMLDGEWQTVTEENKEGFRFFKVVVEGP